MLGLVYAQTLAGVYAQNKARTQLKKEPSGTQTVETAAATLPPLNPTAPETTTPATTTEATAPATTEVADF